MEDITIRFNGGRMVATFHDKSHLNRWLKFYKDNFNEPYMYTIHGIGEIISVEKYIKNNFEI